MAVKIRLTRKGRKQSPFYHIVVADARSPRDGKFIEKIGTYNPMTKPATIEIDRTAAYDWLVKGAQPTDTVKAIMRFKGVYYKKHLMRGVKKGALTTEQADTMLDQWIETKEGKIESRRLQVAKELADFRIAVSGEPGKRAKAPVADASAANAAEAFKADESVEIAPSVNEEVVEAAPVVNEETPAVVEEETQVEAAVEDAPVTEVSIDSSTVEEAPVEESVVIEDAPVEVVESEEAAAPEEVVVSEEVVVADDTVVSDDSTPASDEAPAGEVGE